MLGSLSNCFILPPPEDSYGGILHTDEQLVQLMKRRGGVGINLDTLRPSNTLVSNAARSSTGAVSFMERYSNSTREVAQGGRRGALMLLMDCRHPDIFKFVTAKKDRTKVTGANISVMLTDEFMQAAKGDEDFICRFPLNYTLPNKDEYEFPKIYNQLDYIS
jgi:ribonucleoside-diphosphate reductase alpha chain